jgi:hypothetical protein
MQVSNFQTVNISELRQFINNLFFRRMDKKPKEDMRVSFDKSLAEIKIYQRNESNIDEANTLPRISEDSLLEKASEHGLENDQQTRMFIKFLSVSTNFASHKFADRVQTIPTLINTIRDLIQVAKAELRDYNDIGVLFDEVVSSYVRLVLHTVQNLEMTLPYLQNSVTYMEIVREAMLGEGESLTEQDLTDIEQAFKNMSAGVDKLKEYAKESKEARENVEQRINGLQESMESKIGVIGNRICFSKFIPKIAASTGKVLFSVSSFKKRF